MPLLKEIAKQIRRSLKTTDIALAQIDIHGSFECGKGSIPFTRFNFTNFNLNKLQYKLIYEYSTSQYRFKEVNLYLAI